MKTLPGVIMAVAFALAICVAGCDARISPPPPQPPRKIPPVAERKDTSKPRVKVFTGTIVAVDQSAGTLTLKGPKRELEFLVGDEEKKQLDGLRLGDKLIVKHVGETALSIVKLRASGQTRSESGSSGGETQLPRGSG